MGAGITLCLGQGEDTVCIRAKGLSESQCPNLPMWASSSTLGKRPISPSSDASAMASVSPAKRIRSVAVSSSKSLQSLDDDPETVEAVLGSSFADMSVLAPSTPVSTILDLPTMLSSSIPFNPISDNQPFNLSSDPFGLSFPSSHSFFEVLLVVINILIFVNDTNKISDISAFFCTKFGV